MEYCHNRSARQQFCISEVSFRASWWETLILLSIKLPELALGSARSITRTPCLKLCAALSMSTFKRGPRAD